MPSRYKHRICICFFFCTECSSISNAFFFFLIFFYFFHFLKNVFFFLVAFNQFSSVSSFIFLSFTFPILHIFIFLLLFFACLSFALSIILTLPISLTSFFFKYLSRSIFPLLCFLLYFPYFYLFILSSFFI